MQQTKEKNTKKASNHTSQKQIAQIAANAAKYPDTPLVYAGLMDSFNIGLSAKLLTPPGSDGQEICEQLQFLKNNAQSLLHTLFNATYILQNHQLELLIDGQTACDLGDARDLHNLHKFITTLQAC